MALISSESKEKRCQTDNAKGGEEKLEQKSYKKGVKRPAHEHYKRAT